jgi:hypothetical protein
VATVTPFSFPKPLPIQYLHKEFEMLITRTSDATGLIRSRDLPVTPEQVAAFEAGKGLVQDIFPQLNDDDREFILTGMTKGEWDDIFEEYSSYRYERQTDAEHNDIPF